MVCPPKVHLNQIVSEYMMSWLGLFTMKNAVMKYISYITILHIVIEENSLKLIKPFFKNIMLRI